MRVLIVGGVAGGASTAARLRRLDESAEIVLFERSAYVSYANCGLPYYIGGTIAERDRLFVQTPEGFRRTFAIDVRTGHEVLAIERSQRSITVRDLNSGDTSVEPYDVLVLSPGAEPIRPPIPGVDLPGIYTLRSVADTDRIKAAIDDAQPRHAVVVGAGFIGLEMAENLQQRGVAVTVVEMAPQVMGTVDPEIAAAVHRELADRGAGLYLGNGVASFERSDGRLSVHLTSGKALSADMVILSIGVRPDASLAREAGLTIGTTGGIWVDSTLRTSDASIYACGDAVEFPNPITAQPTLSLLAGPANKQGRIVADNIVARSKGNAAREYSGSIQTAIAKVFDLTVATTGASQSLLHRLSVEHRSVVTHSGSHAGYYPGAAPLTIKTIFHPSNRRVLGAQIVGTVGVDKRIDLIASVVRRGGTIDDLAEIEHAYAPPFASAKDPVNIAGFVAQNVLAGRSRHLQWYQLDDADRATTTIVDVRSREEYALGAIRGAINVPLDQLRARAHEIPRDRSVVVYCAVGQRAYNAERILRQLGYSDVANLSGGYRTYALATTAQGNEIELGADQQQASSGCRDSTDAAGAILADALARTEPAPPVLQVDACGLQCPGPILKLKTAIDTLESGARLELTATDPGFSSDVASWCNMTGNRLIDLTSTNGVVRALVEKPHPAVRTQSDTGAATHNGSTIVVFSDDMDRALASLVIANGAASAGRQVTLFFTFWGLSLLKNDRKPKVRKDLVGRMFGWMLPDSIDGLKLSKMNFGGVGAALMKARMKQQRVDPIAAMLQTARDAGTRLVACHMSMGVMGVAREELIDGVEIGGVASYLEATETAGLNLFI